MVDTKRIIAVVLALSLLIVSVSAAGANDVYLVEEDAGYLEVVDESEWYSFSESAYANGGGASTYDLTNTESTSLLNIEDTLTNLYNLVLWGFDTNLDSIWVRQGTMVEYLKELETRVGVYYQYYDGTISTTSSSTTLSDIVRYGYLGLGAKLDDLVTAVNDSSAADYSSILNSISSDVASGLLDNDTIISYLYNTYLQAISIDTQLEDLIDSVATESTLSALSGKVATDQTLLSIADYLHGSVGQPVLNSRGLLGEISSVESAFITSIVRAGFSGLGNILTIPQDKPFLNQYGEVSQSYSSEGGGFISSILRVGFLGIRSNLYSLFVDPVEYEKLATDGTRKTSLDLSSYDLPSINRTGFMGLASVVYGSESDNTYAGTITGNDNIETSFSAIGLGPMLNQYLDAVQHDTGLLSYMFASPEDLELKSETANLGTSVSDSFFSGEAEGAKIDLNTVSGLKDVADGAGDMFDSGYGLTDLFSAFDDSEALSWFTAETAYALDSTTQVMSVGDEDPYNMYIYYEQLNAIAQKRGEGNNG